MKRYVFQITPMGAPRMVHSDKWAGRPVVQRYFTFRDELRLQARQKHYELKDTLNITFYIPMPESWSKKKKEEMNGKPHQQKFDIDNGVKGFLDTMTYNDAHVWDCHARKFWAYQGAIIVEE